MDLEEKMTVGKDGESNSPEVGKSSVAPSTGALRKQRIEDFQNDALAASDPLQANLGAINGALMRMSYHMETALEAALITITDPVDRFARLGPAIDAYLKVTRQIDRFAQLDNRLSSPQDASASKPR
jgi:hypothetical protein